MFLGCMLTVLVITVLRNGWQQVQWALLAGATVSFTLGLYDDFKAISPSHEINWSDPGSDGRHFLWRPVHPLFPLADRQYRADFFLAGRDFQCD